MSEPRFGWTQPCCESCFERHNPGRKPTRLIEPEGEICVHCGAETQDGIYVRVDPKTAPHPTLIKD